MKQRLDKKGYRRVELCRDYKKTGGLAHRLIAKTFISNPQNLPQVHINGKKDDNRVENSEWCSNDDNMKHAWTTGLFDNRESKARETSAGVTMLETSQL
jgi:hypothetical protein